MEIAENQDDETQDWASGEEDPEVNNAIFRNLLFKYVRKILFYFPFPLLVLLNKTNYFSIEWRHRRRGGQEFDDYPTFRKLQKGAYI